MVSAKHPLTKRKPLRLADCAEFPLAISDHSMTIRPAIDLAFTRANIPLHPTVETNSIEFMKKIARSGQAITFLNPVDVSQEVQAGEIQHLPLHELESHPISLKLLVRARGGLDTFPSLVVEELRKAMPRLELRRGLMAWRLPANAATETSRAGTCILLGRTDHEGFRRSRPRQPPLRFCRSRRPSSTARICR